MTQGNLLCSCPPLSILLRVLLLLNSMEVVDSTENVADVLETRLNISAGLTSSSGAIVPASTHEDSAVIDVEVDFPHLNALKDNLYVPA